jgi:branched-chain amino acid transport system permease protein
MIGIMLSRPRGLWPSPEHGRAGGAASETPPAPGIGGELPTRVTHVDMAPGTQIPPVTGHLVPTDR